MELLSSSSIVTFAIVVIATAGFVSGIDPIGDSDCVIRSEAACQWITENLGFVFTSSGDGGGGNYAWGCFINGGEAARWDGSGAEKYAEANIVGGNKRKRIFGDDQGDAQYGDAKNICKGLDFVGNPVCVIDTEAGCEAEAISIGRTFLGPAGDTGDAWGCFLNKNGDVRFDGSKDDGGSEYYDAIDVDGAAERQRLFCDGTLAPTTTPPTPAPTTTPLDVKWGITPPLLAVKGLAMTIDYDINNNIEPSQTYYEVYDKDCTEGGVLLTTGFNKGDIQGGVDDVTQIPVTVDMATIEDPSVPEGVYTELDNGSLVKIEYCLYFALNSLDGSYTVNFLETVISVTYDLSDGVAVGMVLTTKDKDANDSTKTYNVRAYKCLPRTDTPIDDKTAALAIGQGSLITVCVKPDAQSIADGIEMLSIESFKWTRDAGNAINQPAIEQAAIESKVAALNSLTEFDNTLCAGSAYCQFSSILFATFYATAGQVSGSGVATLRFSETAADSSRRRRRVQVLRNENDREGEAQRQRPRALQQVVVPDATSDFDLSVTVQDTGQDNGFQLTSAGTSIGVDAITVTVAASILGHVATAATVAMIL